MGIMLIALPSGIYVSKNCSRDVKQEKIMKIFFGMISIFVLINCSNHLNDEGDNNEIIKVSVGLPKDNLSLYTTNLLSQITSYDLVITNENDDEIMNNHFSKNDNIFFNLLSEGRYNFILTAYNGQTKIGGSIKNTYLSSENKSVQLLLEPNSFGISNIVPNIDIGKTDSANGGPRSICVDSSGVIYFADSLNSRLLKLNANGQVISFWSSINSQYPYSEYGTTDRVYLNNDKLGTSKNFFSKC
jgi:hypothetical protein